MFVYAGIGSRTSPISVILQMERFGIRAANLGGCLRSGGAAGADSAFERGCDIRNGKKEIFLPFRGFNNRTSNLYPPSMDAMTLATSVHPRYHSLSTVAKLLLARNMHQILGSDLNDPVDIVVCYTPDGCVSESTYSKSTGGTGTAIVLADRYNIPIFNFNRECDIIKAFKLLTKLGDIDERV